MMKAEDLERLIGWAGIIVGGLVGVSIAIIQVYRHLKTSSTSSPSPTSKETA